MTFVSPKTITRSVPILIMRMLGGVPKEDRSKLKLLFDTSCAEMLHKLLPDYEYMTVNVYNNRKLYYDPRLYFVPFFFCRAVNHSGCDAVFYPSDGNMYAKFKTKIKSLVMINDVKLLKDDMQNKKKSIRSIALRLLRGNEYERYKKTIERASLITTNSQYTKDDLLRFFPETPAEKVHVIYLSVPKVEGSKKPEGIEEGENYILNVNSFSKFKNPITLLKAFLLISNQYKGKLVLVGRTTKYWNDVLVPFIKENGLEERVVHLQDIDDTELRYVYEHADLFVTPSLHEGFGFTPVEAAIYGSPVVSSRCESLPEATMGMVNYYEPANDEHALMKAMVEVLKNPPSEEKREAISKAFSDRYSTENHARNIMNFFSMLYK